ncbi:NADP-dependent oxidoreductase [Sulfitobacter sp. M57]|jgi:NADPH2:quinone reductase|uniref:quinone oxidoreductase family protein n=1 Tax=unclassified Sulfitobacter TaxID=196795 RepID=UPI0023E2D9D0|nr:MULTISPECIES: NADP-dependent oxidoreductase [unclassified Sulfitobacter]MDF3416333.1 NADP-dependent oxidoreductase [Sulfitobacter sp. KE5]MDF3423812.1 NADP-dependent oxidoreductase [Sulfitobacter sp. KE43]MDF3434879.1 NADP-dependent oxidoreductase [Sulfitobacter sp. KE42]MDF3460518.1 NADP-dependent oxidoreductase [Sulfitobacter sp. S74]MDF3464416.1 NADP-dependent oxidoreductase [Sulfitobacter sp. Ks18]
MTTSNEVTNAIQISAYGPPEGLVLAPMALAPLRPDEVRIRTIAAAVNHTDLEIRSGNWPIRNQEPFPYVPGVEVVGEIAEIGASVHGISPGDRVITMMQGLGGVRGERPGGYAELVTVAADSVAPIGSATDPYVMAAIGLGGVTAYEGLRRIGSLAGNRILVTGAAGGVGSAAVAIAKAQGATVVGVVSRVEQSDYVRGLGADEIALSARDAPPDFEAASIDGILDTVGAPVFEMSLRALKPGGVLSLVGAVGGSDVRFDLWDLIRPVTLTGYSSESLDGPALRGAMAALTGWIKDGSIAAPRYTTVPLAEAARAHAMLESRGVSGRVLLIP